MSREREAQPQSKDPLHNCATVSFARGFYYQSGCIICSSVRKDRDFDLEPPPTPDRLHDRITFMASGPGRLRSFTIVIALSAILFALMQLLFGGSHCNDCGATIGFPFSYMREGTWGTHGRFRWLGFLGDAAIAAALATLVVWMWGRRKTMK